MTDLIKGQEITQLLGLQLYNNTSDVRSAADTDHLILEFKNSKLYFLDELGDDYEFVNLTPAGNLSIAGSGTFSNVILTGALGINLTATSARIYGTFGDATLTTGTFFQSNITNGSTSIGVMPNGSATISNILFHSSSDPTNSAIANIGASSTLGIFTYSQTSGAGVLLPITWLFNGTERMRLDTSGNLGIGMTPVYKLDVNGSLGLYANAGRILVAPSSATVTDRTFVQTSTVDGTTVLGMIPNGTSTTSQWQAYNNSNPTNAAFLALRATSTATSLYSGVSGSGTQLPLAFFMGAAGGSEVARFDTSGNLGIGNTPSGTYKLEVTGAGSFSSDIVSGGNVTANGGNFVASGTVPLLRLYETDAGTDQKRTDIFEDGGILYHRFVNDAANAVDIWMQVNRNSATYTTKEVLFPNGKVMVGSGTPVAKLHSSVADGTYQFGVSGTTMGLRVLTNGAAVYLEGVDNTLSAGYRTFVIGGSTLYFTLSGTAAMLLESTGNLGIGTSAPLSRLHTTIENATTNAATNVLTIGTSTSGTPAAGLGIGVQFVSESSTTADVLQGGIYTGWGVVTHASRTAEVNFYATDFAATRICVKIGANGTAATIGFLGAAAVIRQAMGAWAGLTDAQRITALRDALTNLGLTSYT